jgi:dolichyl-phosphate beta-glucosyltransferase
VSALEPSPPPRIRLSVIIPAFNETNRLPRTLEALLNYATGRGSLLELVVVDDGSTDDTADAARAFAIIADPRILRITILVNDRNRGKGYSVRRGMMAVSGELRLLCDADLSTPIEEADRLIPMLADADIVIASRDKPDSILSPPQPWHRRFLAKSLRTVRRIFLLRRLRDTQCGFKLFTAEAATAVFPLSRVDGFAFDVEVLALADRLGYRITEAGVTWRDDRDTRVRPIRDGLRMLLAVFTIWWRVKGVERKSAEC